MKLFTKRVKGLFIKPYFSYFQKENFLSNSPPGFEPGNPCITLRPL